MSPWPATTALADGVQAGGAVARHGRAVRGLAELVGQQHGDAGDVVGLQALRQATAGDELLDGSGIDVGVALEQLIHDERERLVGAQRGERALEGSTHGRPDGVDDDGFGHENGPLGDEARRSHTTGRFIPRRSHTTGPTAFQDMA
jgi:hypothetical protein